MKIQIRLATSPEELEAVYRFRYAIYVEEMHRRQKYADHEAKQIYDPLDPGSYVFGAWADGELAGTLRTNFLRETDIGEYFEMYQLGYLPETVQKHTQITTRLMIQPRFRNGTLAVRLSKALYRFALERGITTDLIDCNAHLIPFFTGLGYRLFRDDLVHPEYGAVTVLKLDLYDHYHFQQISSPILPILQEWNSQRQTRQLQTTQ